MDEELLAELTQLEEAVKYTSADVQSRLIGQPALKQIAEVLFEIHKDTLSILRKVIERG